MGWEIYTIHTSVCTIYFSVIYSDYFYSSTFSFLYFLPLCRSVMYRFVYITQVSKRNERNEFMHFPQCAIRDSRAPYSK